jgi:hypothetical protein
MSEKVRPACSALEGDGAEQARSYILGLRDRERERGERTILRSTELPLMCRAYFSSGGTLPYGHGWPGDLIFGNSGTRPGVSSFAMVTQASAICRPAVISRLL